MARKPVSYKQTDPRWASLPYQTEGERATIGGSGCGPTCAAMLIQTVTGQTFTPEQACRWSVEHGYKAKGRGTFYSYFEPQFAAFGIRCGQMNFASLYGEEKSPVHDRAKEWLREGGYLIACMGPGRWTRGGHFVVVWGLEGDEVCILDPASDRPDRLRCGWESFCREVKYYWQIDTEEDDMSYETWKQYMQCYRRELAEALVSDWAQALLAQAVENGITDGTRPRDLVTREEAAAMCLAVLTPQSASPTAPPEASDD